MEKDEASLALLLGESCWARRVLVCESEYWEIELKATTERGYWRRRREEREMADESRKLLVDCEVDKTERDGLINIKSLLRAQPQKRAHSESIANEMI